MTDAMAGAGATIQAPSLSRRMASFVYEGLILFGMLLIPGALGAVLVALTGQQHSQQSDLILEVFSFSLYAAYFTWFWSTRGQTLPMQTWQIRVVTPTGDRPGWRRALCRYFAAWLWVAPAGALAMVNHWTIRDDPRLVGACIVAWIAIYALLALLLPQRQFLHDLLCGTRLASAPAMRRHKG